MFVFLLICLLTSSTPDPLVTDWWLTTTMPHAPSFRPSSLSICSLDRAWSPLMTVKEGSLISSTQSDTLGALKLLNV